MTTDHQGYADQSTDQSPTLSRPIPAGCEWGVIRDGRLASAHRSLDAAKEAAGSDGLVAAIEAAARRLDVSIGDKVSLTAGGQVLPR